jgi:hypothetical protein
MAWYTFYHGTTHFYHGTAHILSSHNTPFVMAWYTFTHFIMVRHTFYQQQQQQQNFYLQIGNHIAFGKLHNQRNIVRK